MPSLPTVSVVLGASGTVGGIVRFLSKENPMDNKRDPHPMKEPMKPHGDKIDLDRDGDRGARDRKSQQPVDDTARVGGAAYAPHEPEAEELAENTGDKPTPDKLTGEIKPAGQPHKKQGGAHGSSE
jgi:hypothetical protein